MRYIRPRRVNFGANAEDLACAVLGSLGFSTAYIEKAVGLSPGQIQYRLHKAAVSRLAYRNGSSDAAGLVLQRVKQQYSHRLRERLTEPTRKRKAV